ncbi:PAS domain S-box protein [Natrinema gelatinilyticum]|uniref:PAS domain S-box protein n=1 Tax=Natrinema gelatinilyticum TaxID=2961571 RepID=UPI0020C2F671|nr:PAS domain S-box protein [Natrinema gelatinilyticum]
MTISSLTETLRETLSVFDESGAPLTTTEVADRFDLGRRSIYERLERLVDHGELETKMVGVSGRVWWRPPSPTATQPRRKDDRHLVESERHYRTLVENFPNGIVTLFDHDLTYTLAAGQEFATLPVEPSDLEGSHFREVWPAEAADALQPALQAALNGEYYSVELAYVGREWIVHAVPVTNEHGTVLAGMTVAQDITEQKKRERNLERYKGYIDDVLDTVGDIFYLIDEDGALQRWNQSLADVTGYTNEELASMSPVDLSGSDEQETVVTAIAECFETGSVTVELTVQTKDGETIPFEFDASTLEDPWGNTVFAGIGRDVTDRVERERRLERYEAIVEEVNDGVYVVDEDGTFTMVNETYAELLGCEPDELIGADTTEIVDEAVIERVRELEIATTEGETDWPTLAAEVTTADGERIPAEATFSMLPADDSGWHRVGIVRDISERKAYERQLEESERRYRTLAEHFPNGAVGLFDEDFCYTAAGGELMDEMGIDPEERVGCSVYDLYPDEIIAEIEPYFRTVFDGEANEFAVEYHGRQLRAHTLPVRTVNDEIYAGMVMVQDISERKARERELDKRARQQRAVADLGQLALETDDLDELMDEASRRVASVLDNEYCNVLDLDDENEEFLLRHGVGWKDGIVGEATVSAAEGDSQAVYTLANDHPIVVEDLETETRFGGPELLTSHDVRSGISTIIGPSSEPWGILGTHDTERKPFTDEDVNFVQSVANVLADAIKHQQYQTDLETLVADLEDSNDRLEQFAYAASHDLQEPLRMVISYLQLLEKRYGDAFDEDGEEFLGFAVDGAERMRAMIDGLLEYSRVETQGDPFEPTELNALLDDVLVDLQLQIEESNAEITAEDLPRVEGDANQLRRVFQNLLSNALTYSGDEPPRVHFGADRRDGEWVISVTDEGIGIDPADHDRVFSVFDRLHSRKKYEGAGIGLALCERIVERHRGEIWVDSEPDEGATFSFTLPT